MRLKEVAMRIGSVDSCSSSVHGSRALAGLTRSAVILGLAFFQGPSTAGAGEIPDGGDQGTVLIAEGHVWKFFRGTEAPPAGWNQPGFDDTAWQQGPTGIGYGDGDDQTVLEDMRCTFANGEGEENPCTGGGYLAFFARTTFERPSIPAEQKLFVKVSYDDGFVLHVNGIQVGRVNMPEGEVSYTTAAASAVGDAPTAPDAVVVIPAEVLQDGINVLAASVHNVNLSSTDASFIPRLIVGNPEGSGEEPGCKDRCAARAAEAFQACLAEGLGEEACAAKKAAVLEECLRSECGVEPPDEPTCKERCSARAAEAFQACIADGLTEKECLAKKAAVLEECLVSECGVEPPDEPTCEQLCKEAAAKALSQCLQEGGSEEECVAQKAAVLQECLRSECGVEPPDEPTCEELCEKGAAKAFQLCIEEGKTEEECHVRAQALLEDCIEGCGESPPDKPCAEECAAAGNAVFLACLEAGGDKEECRSHADGIVGLCLERCGTGTPCEDRCAVAAQIVLTGCALGQLTEEECNLMANTILEKCLPDCEPAPSCESGCEELAQRAVGECKGRGGEEGDCKAEGAAVLADCLSHCEGKPIVDCDRQCEEKADELFARCVAEGKSEADCQAKRAEFVVRCKEELGEICAQELAALASPFQPFERGDSNRDGAVDISDSISILGYLFLGTEVLFCEDAADANDDGLLDMTDPILILSSLFLGTGPLPAPSGEKAQDPTSDELLCAI